MEDIQGMLDAEYEATLNEIKTLKAGSAEAEWQLRKLCELGKQRETERRSSDESFKILRETELKEEELKGAKKDRLIKIVLGGAELLVTSYWLAKGLKFEESGAFISKTWNWVANGLRIFKRGK
nr:MAG TPA: hypothetical protein [Caudoviricetes sp.]